MVQKGVKNCEVKKGQETKRQKDEKDKQLKRQKYKKMDRQKGSWVKGQGKRWEGTFVGQSPQGKD